MSNLGTLEIGGTKTLVALGHANGSIQKTLRIETSDDSMATLLQAIDFLKGSAVKAVGVAAFGPLELRPGNIDFGHVLSTPKPGWTNTDVLGTVQREIGVPVCIDTDVNAAALSEGKWGASAGLENHVYITVGTGVGFGVVVSGSILMGNAHTEMGHIPVTAHQEDPFPGSCPFHGGCLEGMVSGPALADRFGQPAETLEHALAEEATRLVAFYMGQAIRTVAYTTAPERVVLGGGISNLPDLHRSVHGAFIEALGGYREMDIYSDPNFVVAPALRDSGLSGGLILARRAWG